MDVIAGEIRRLDEVVQGFLKFTRPEDLKLQPVRSGALFDEVMPIVRPEAERTGVELVVECDGALEVNGDPGDAAAGVSEPRAERLSGDAARRHAAASPARSCAGRRVVDHRSRTRASASRPSICKRIFDLYFTTKDRGSGIGLSMVYRTVQMHDGEIEVQSTPGKGTTFRVLLPQA